MLFCATTPDEVYSTGQVSVLQSFAFNEPCERDGDSSHEGAFGDDDDWACRLRMDDGGLISVQKARIWRTGRCRGQVSPSAVVISKRPKDVFRGSLFFVACRGAARSNN